MVEYDPEQLSAVFHALADPTRRAMLQSLTQGERNVSELAAPFDMSLEAASKHIKVLERAGMIQRSIKGRTHVCRLDAQPMHGGLEWIRHYERFWTRRLDQLEQRLHAEDQAAEKPRTRRKARRKK